MSTNEQSELTQFQENGYEKSKYETKFILAEEKKKEWEADQYRYCDKWGERKNW